MKTSSAKQKGRVLQQWVRDSILKYFPSLEAGDVVSTSMGAGGVDVKLSPAALKLLPIAIECKNQEKIALYPSYDQAKANCKGFEPVLIIKKNRHEPLAVVRADWLLKELAKR